MANMPDVPDSFLEKPLTLPEDEGPSGSHGKPRRKSFIKKSLISILILIILGGAGFGGWKYLQNKQDKRAAQASTSQVNTAAKEDSTNDVPNAASTKVFTSDTLTLQLNLPTNWSAATKEDGLMITSPTFSYMTTDKGQANGNFRIYIRMGARTIDGKYIGSGVAVAPSETLTYSQPGIDQRKTTGFTQFGSETSDHFTFFMVTGDFQLKKDDTLGPNYGKEASTYIIVGGYSTPALTDDLAFSNVPLNQYQTKHVYTQALNIVKSLKLQ